MRKFISFLIFLIIISTVIYLYGRYVEPKRLIVKENSIVDNNLASNFHGLKIVQFSDLLFDNEQITIKEVKNIVKNINSLKPDIVIFTGNLFKNNYKPKDNIIVSIKNELNKINSTINNYASITKNDNNYLNILENFIVLDNTNTEIFYNGLTPIKIVGYTNELEKSFINITNEDYVILLSHNPDIIDKSKNYKINIMFSGKSLGGEVIIPYFGGMIKNTKYLENYYEINKTKLFINSGIGTKNKLKIRLFNPPTINLYRLYSK